MDGLTRWDDDDDFFPRTRWDAFPLSSHSWIAMHHGKCLHQAFLECSVLIKPASRRRHECKTPLCVLQVPMQL